MISTAVDEVEPRDDASPQVGMSIVHPCVDDGDPNCGALRELVSLKHTELLQVALQRKVGPAVGGWSLRVGGGGPRLGVGAGSGVGLRREPVERLDGLHA